jgi:hypothetical protein
LRRLDDMGRLCTHKNGANKLRAIRKKRIARNGGASIRTVEIFVSFA